MSDHPSVDRKEGQFWLLVALIWGEAELKPSSSGSCVFHRCRLLPILFFIPAAVADDATVGVFSAGLLCAVCPCPVFGSFAALAAAFCATPRSPRCPAGRSRPDEKIVKIFKFTVSYSGIMFKNYGI